MGFQQGLSGLSVSSKALDAIGNNVANANTVGFKSSTVQFADVYAASLSGSGANQIGIGASAPGVSQLFTQGNLTVTNNPLDLAINGGGFFRLNDGGTAVYSRNGQFNVDKDGYIVNSGGIRLTGYGADATGAIVPGDFVDMRLITTNIEPYATTRSEVQLNLDSRSDPPAAMTSGSVTGNATPTNLTIGTGNDQLDLTIDGYSGVVTIPAKAYASVSELATALENAINDHPTFRSAGALVDVSLDTSGFMIITSRSQGTNGLQGAGSYVSVGTGNGVSNLLGNAPVESVGRDNFDPSITTSYTASTAQTVYDTLGNPHNLTMYFSKTSQVNNWQMYTSLDGEFTEAPATSGTLTGAAFRPSDAAAVPPYVNPIDAGGTISLIIDGVSTPVTIPAAAYATADDVVNAINDVANWAPLTARTATASNVDGAIVITSNTTGSSSGVSIDRSVAANFPSATAIFGQSSTQGTLTGVAPTADAYLGGDLNLTIDGTNYLITVGVPGTADLAGLTAAIQAALDAAGAQATVSDDGTGIVITSDSSGAGSSVSLTGNTFSAAVFGGTGISVAGVNADSDGTVVVGEDIRPFVQTLTFNSVGALTTAMPIDLNFDPATGATNPLSFELDFTGTSQYGINFGVNQLLQDGYSSGRLSGISVSTDGIVQGRYSNGKTRNMGQLVLVNFNNPNGLNSLGGNLWAESAESGQPIPGTPGQGSLGVIQSAAIEESNVDLTAELVNMITQQRVYQANAQTIRTQDQILQTLVNLR